MEHGANGPFFSLGTKGFKQLRPFKLIDESVDGELVAYHAKIEELRELLPSKYQLHDAIGEAFLC